MNKKLILWSKRTSVARGNYWQNEREVTNETAQDWLKVFRDDEPNVLFIVSSKKPKD